MKYYRVDEKGKFYTAVVNKRMVRVIVSTRSNVIHGIMHRAPDNRLKDELNDIERFVAITDAEVFDQSGETREQTAALLVLNKEQIVWLVPQEEEREEKSS